jgi:pyruvate formate lyase activating enzyme
METTGTIFDLKRFAVHDGPGIRTTVFLKGCPLHCAWCHNPEGIHRQAQWVWFESRCIGCDACLAACPNAALERVSGELVVHHERCDQCGRCREACYADALFLYGRQVSVAEVMAELRQDAAFYRESGGGVTLSGGEPLAQANFATTLLRQCKAEGFSTALDTCGAIPWPILSDALAYTDLVLYDLKPIDPELHRQTTGMSNSLVLENLRRIDQLQVPVEIRIPLIPGVTDGHNLELVCAFLKTLQHPVRVRLLPYHRLAGSKYQRLGLENRMPAVESPTPGQMQAAARQLSGCGCAIDLE